MKTPAFQFYPNDWLSSTNIMLMTPAEEGAYIRLLAISWNNENCDLPDDDEQLAILSRLGEGWFNGGSTKIRKCFKAKGNRLYNERLLEERKKQEEWREKSRQGGIKSGKSRNNKDLDDEGSLKGGSEMVGTKREPKGNSSSSSSSSSSKKKKDIIIPPKIEDVTAYCQKRNNGIDPQTFIDHYEARGWIIGKNRMKDWMAAVRTWENNKKNNPLFQQQPSQPEDPIERAKRGMGL
jgi:uncharacterized protein YdaU (DUF1376 family)